MTTDPTATEHRPVLPIFVGDRVLPDGCDRWGIRSVRADFRSSNGFRWPFPGQWAEASGPFNEANTDGCPSNVGDGLCVADTFRGMASGGIPARTVLLCAYSSADVLGTTRGDDKHRVRRVFVVDLIDGESFTRADLAGADLTRADLTRADLTGADLTGAYLTGANLTGAAADRYTVWPTGFDHAARGVVTR